MADCGLSIILEMCPENFQFLDTYRLCKLTDLKQIQCENHNLLLIADDNLDGLKLAISSNGNMLIYDPDDNSIWE